MWLSVAEPCEDSVTAASYLEKITPERQIVEHRRDRSEHPSGCEYSEKVRIAVGRGPFRSDRYRGAMKTFSTVVVALDDSLPAQRAAAFAAELAKREGALLRCCTAIDPLTPRIARAIPLLASNDAAKRGIDATAQIVEGEPVTAISAYAAAHDASAIVVGTHGRRGLNRVVLGSVACGLLRAASVPVFVVGAEARIDGDGPIVAAVDGSAPSAAALAVATALAQSEATTLHLVHVFDDHDLARIPDHPGYDPVVAHERAMSETRRELNTIAETVRAQSPTLTAEMPEGDPVAETILAAVHLNARFIAVGTHARNAMGRFLSGSVAEQLIRESTVPVMVVKAPR